MEGEDRVRPYRRSKWPRPRSINLRNAITTARTIGVAIDILVERYDIAPEAAFARLVDASQRHNVKVRQLAEELALSRQDPYDGGPVPADGTGCSPPPDRLTPAGLGHHADVSRGRLVINP